MTNPTPRWLDRREAAAYLGISCSTLDRWARAGVITRYAVGPSERLRFDSRELRKLANKVSALPA